MRIKLIPGGRLSGVLILREPTLAESSKFSNDRQREMFRLQSNKPCKLAEVRHAFVVSLLSGAEDLVLDGEPLDASQDGWRERIPFPYIEGISLRLEAESVRVLGDDDEKNSEPPSES